MDTGRFVVQPRLFLLFLLLVVVSRMRAFEGWMVLRHETGESVTSRSARNGCRSASEKDMLDLEEQNS